jgi:threonine/homoserine/homoserine lactone efflux protein
MLEEFEQKRQSQVSTVRSLMNYIMGFLFIIFGLYFLLYEELGINFLNRDHTTLDYLIGILFLVYGGWRMYRGYKKNYFTE